MKRFLFLHFFLVFLCLSSSDLNAQEEVVCQQYAIYDGLPAVSGNKLIKDQKGYLWIGTHNGLSHFDGHSFTNIPRGNANGHIQGAKIMSISHYGKEELIIGTDVGIATINIRDFTTKNILLDKDESQFFENNFVLQMLKSKEGGFWVLTKNNIYFLNNALEIRDQFKLPIGNKEGIRYLMSPRLVELNNGNLLFMDLLHLDQKVNNTIYEYDKSTHKISEKIYPFITSTKHYSGILRLDDDHILFIEDHLGKVKTFMYNEHANEAIEVHFPVPFKDDFYPIFINYQGKIAVSIYGIQKLVVFDNIHHKWNVVSDSILHQTKLLRDYCQIDENSAFWLGDFNLYHLKKVQTNDYEQLVNKTKDAFDWSNLRSKIEVSDSVEWFIDNNFNFKAYNKLNHTFRNVLTDNQIAEIGKYIQKVFVINEGKGVLFVTDNGLKVYDLHSQKFNYLKGVKNYSNYFDRTAFNAFDDGHQSIWLNSVFEQNLYKLDLKKNKMTTYSSPFIDKIYYTGFAHTSNGMGYLVSPNAKGILCIQEKNDSIFKIFPRLNEHYYISNISKIITDQNDRLWLFTDGYGVHCIDSKSYKTVKSYTTSDGLFSNYISEASKDKNGNFWVSTPTGINLINPITFAITNISHSFIDNSHHILNFVDPYQNFILLKKHNKYIVYDVDIYGKPRDFTNIEVIKIEHDGKLLTRKNDSFIQLSQSNKNIHIYFRYKNFTDGRENKYFYTTALDKSEWIENKTNIISLANLVSGSNTLWIRVCYTNGMCDEQKVLVIYVKPYLWQHAWFWISLACLIFGTLLYFYIKELKEKKIISEKLTAQLQFLQAKMNPHFIFNSLNSINRFILVSEKLQASEYLSKFANLMRKTMSNSNYLWISLDSEIEMLELYISIESIRFADKFKHFTHVDPSLNLSVIKIPPLILQPFVENSLWHGFNQKKDECRLTIRLLRSDLDLIIEIEDNGLGRDKALEAAAKKTNTKTSEGLNTTINRLAAFEQLCKIKTKLDILDLRDEHGNATGTKVQIKFFKILNESR